MALYIIMLQRNIHFLVLEVKFSIVALSVSIFRRKSTQILPNTIEISNEKSAVKLLKKIRNRK